MHPKRSLWMVLVLLVALLATGCVFGTIEVGPTQTETSSIEAGDVTAVDVEINMGVGQLRVDGGADTLLDAEFTYNIAEWAPEVNYAASGSTGNLTVNQPEYNIEDGGVPSDDVRYEWDLRFGGDKPLDMVVNLGVGDSELDFSGLNLSALDVNTGVGSVVIDLSGDWAEPFDVTIEGGVGETTVYLPSDAGVRVTATTGIGDLDVFGLTQNGDVYTNAAAEDGVVVDLEITGGIGQIRLEMRE